MPIPRVVLDSVIFVRCLINPPSRWGCLVFLHKDRYQLVLSEPVKEEILDVVHRPEIQRKLRAIGEFNVSVVIGILDRAEIVEPADITPTARDPKDDPFLATAQAANADYLVTEDNDLLVLGEFAGTRIVNAATFLASLERGDTNPS